MKIDNINNNTYTVDNGEIEVDSIIAMILCKIKRTHENTYKGSIFIDLPDKRRIRCDSVTNTMCWHIIYNLLPSNTDEGKYSYGIVPLREVQCLDNEKIKVIAATLQKFLLDNKYKIAVI